MVKTPLVERQIQDGRRLIEAMQRSGFPVRLAFWLYEEEPDVWRLYLRPATDDPVVYADACLRIRALIPPDSSMMLRDVSVAWPSNLQARAIEEAFAKHPRPLPARIHRTPLRDAYFEDSYVYPIETAAGSA